MTAVGAPKIERTPAVREYFRQYFKRRYKEDHKFREDHKRQARRIGSTKKSLARRAERRRTDPEYRERLNAQYRACYHNTLKHNPKNRIRIRNYWRKRRKDPVVKLKMKEYARAYRERHRVIRLVASAIIRCRKSGLGCDIDFMKSLRHERPEQCPCCRVKLDYAFSGNSGRALVNGPSLDRIDTSKGYIRGNVAIICWRCNALKRDALLHELEAIVAYMKARL